MNSSGYFYEYLPRIGKIYIKLPSGAGDVFLRENSVHFGQNTIELPVEIDENRMNTQKDGTISIQIPPRQLEEETSDNYPWSYKQIQSSEANFLCKSCGSAIIPRSKVGKIKPMPSESWSEMLDLWHCHKPTELEYQSAKLNEKFTKFKPRKNELLIGSYYITVNGDYWELPSDDGSVFCPSCKSMTGVVDEDSNGSKLFKWKLSWSEPFESYQFIQLKLLNEINSTSIRFYTIKNKVLIWCFNFGLDVSINDTKIPNCIKICYKLGTDEVNKFIQDQELVGLYRYQELELGELPGSVADGTVDDLINRLTEINSQLPATVQKFNDWNVSYL